MGMEEVCCNNNSRLFTLHPSYTVKNDLSQIILSDNMIRRYSNFDESK